MANTTRAEARVCVCAVAFTRAISTKPGKAWIVPIMERVFSITRTFAMPVNLSAPVAADLLAINGVRIGIAEAGVRKANRKDLTVFLLDEGASVAGVFTQNRFALRQCRFAASIWLRAAAFAPWSSTPAMPMPALALRVWPMHVPPALRWPRSWSLMRGRSCLFHRCDHGRAARGSHRGRLAQGHRCCQGR